MAYCIEVSARGIAFTRSFARPFTAEKIKRTWWLHDDGPLGSQRRNDEWFATAGTEPEVLHSWARARAAKRFIICAVVKDDREQVELLTKYRNLGYRLWRTEALMTRSTVIDPSCAISSGLIPVDTQSMVSRLAKAARGRMILPEHLEKRPVPVRCHVAIINDQIVGWVRSTSIGDASWCASLFFEPEFRRRGIGRSLVATMLKADRIADLMASIPHGSYALSFSWLPNHWQHISPQSPSRITSLARKVNASTSRIKFHPFVTARQRFFQFAVPDFPAADQIIKIVF